MATYKFTSAQRWAVFSVHGDQCYICGNRLDLQTMEIDHIVPESLGKNRAKLLAVQKRLGLPRDFDVNSFANWMPACRKCNGSKGDIVWQPSLDVQLLLQKAQQKAAEADAAAKKSISDRALSRAINAVERAVDGSELNEGVLMPLFLAFAEKNPEAWKAILEKSPRSAELVPNESHAGAHKVAEFRITPSLSLLYSSDGFAVAVQADGTKPQFGTGQLIDLRLPTNEPKATSREAETSEPSMREMKLIIARLKRRIAEVDSFDLNSVNKVNRVNAISSLARSINVSLNKSFGGKTSAGYKIYPVIARLIKPIVDPKKPLTESEREAQIDMDSWEVTIERIPLSDQEVRGEAARRLSACRASLSGIIQNMESMLKEAKAEEDAALEIESAEHVAVANTGDDLSHKE